VAQFARRGAFIAVLTLAPAAVERLFGIGHVAALMAADAVPLIKLDVGRMRVVRLQNAANEREEVAEPAISQRIGDCDHRITSTEPVTVNVRVHDVLIVGGRVRLHRLDAIPVVRITRRDHVGFEDDLEGTQRNAVEDDRVGADRDATIRERHIDPAELFFGSAELLVQLPHGRGLLPRIIPPAADLLDALASAVQGSFIAGPQSPLTENKTSPVSH
jgi:hypothetical protein